MGSKSFVALAAVACAAALGFFLFFSDSGSGVEDQTVERGGAADTEVARATDPVELETSSPALASASGASSTRATLEAAEVEANDAPHPWDEMLAGVTGRVVEEDGTPVVGLRVELLEGDASLVFAAEHTAMGRRDVDVGDDRTDADGRFTIEGAIATAFHVLSIDGGGGRATIRFVEQGLEYGELTDVGNIVLPKCATVIGVVLDEDGEPVPGARVRLAPVPEPVLQSGVLDLRDDCIVAFGDDENVRSIEIPNWVLANVDRLPVPTGITDGDGAFRIEGVPMTVVAGGVDKAGYVATIITPFDLAVPEYDLEELDLEVGRTVTGRVIDKLGTPVVGAEVRAGALHPVFNVGILQPTALTDEEGRFEVPGIGDLGRVVATARRDARETWVVGLAAGGSSNADVVLPAAAPLFVRATDDAGEPVEGARISMRPRPEQGMGMMMEAGMMGMLGVRATPASFQVTESEPGLYLVDEVGLGDWVVRVEADGHAPAEAEVNHASEETVCEVTCKGGRAVAVVVTDQATGEPVPNAHVRIIGPTETLFGALASRFTDEAGRARLGPIPLPGDESTVRSPFPSEFGLQLTVEHPRFGYVAMGLPDSVEEEVVVELTPACTLRGRVTWAGENPQDVYMLALALDGDGDQEEMLAVFSTPRTTLSDLEGAFKFPGLAAGSYQLMVFRRFLDKDPFAFIIEQQEPEMIYRTSVDVTVGGENTVEVALEADGEGPKAIFAGKVIVEGEPVVGAKVSISGKDDQEILTDAFGEWESEPVDAMGWYNVEINGEVLQPDGTRAEKRLYDDWMEPRSGDVTRIDVVIDYETYVVEVVDSATGAFVEGVWVSIGGSDSAQTNADGQAEVLIEARGALDVNVNGEGYVSFSETRDIDPDEPSPQLRLELTPSVPCKGRVVLPGGETTADWIGLMVWEENDGDRNWNGVDSEELTFEINGLRPGNYRAQMWLNGSQTKEIEFRLGPNGDENLVLQFD